MSEELKGKKIAFLVAKEGIEQVELTGRGRPSRRQAAQPELDRPRRRARCRPSTTWTRARTFTVDHALEQAARRGLRRRWCFPAGWPIPTSCARTPAAVEFVQAIFEAGKPVAVICHGPWTLVEAERRTRPQADVVAVAADRHPQRRRRVGRRAGGRRPGPGHEPQARRPRRRSTPRSSRSSQRVPTRSRRPAQRATDQRPNTGPGGEGRPDAVRCSADVEGEGRSRWAGGRSCAERLRERRRQRLLEFLSHPCPGRLHGGV